MPVKYKRWFFARRAERYHDGEVAVATALWLRWRPKSVYDAGCACGSYLCGFRACGSTVAGSDISAVTSRRFAHRHIRPAIREADLTQLWPPEKKYDLVICINVLEHLAPEATATALRNLRGLTRKRLFFAAATPGQSEVGVGHVNCRQRTDWRVALATFGFFPNHAETLELQGLLKSLGNPFGLARRQIVCNT